MADNEAFMDAIREDVLMEEQRALDEEEGQGDAENYE